MKSPNVSRATKELQGAGIIARRRRYHSGGNVGIQYTFNGLALAKATVEQGPSDAAGRDYQCDNGGIRRERRRSPGSATKGRARLSH